MLRRSCRDRLYRAPGKAVEDGDDGGGDTVSSTPISMSRMPKCWPQ
jgi:hypothetical protein